MRCVHGNEGAQDRKAEQEIHVSRFRKIAAAYARLEAGDNMFWPKMPASGSGGKCTCTNIAKHNVKFMNHES